MGIIRVLLALSILIHHSFPLFGMTLVGRDPALKAFYVISGFYMALIINDKYIGQNGGYKLFITNRFFRIFPAYWLVLICTYTFNFFFLNENFLPHSFLNFIGNFTLILRTDYLQLNTAFREFLLLPQAYTLVLELCFYLIAPFIVKRNIKFLLWISTFALLARILMYVILRLYKQPLADWIFPGVLIYFLLGIFSYKIYKRIKKKTIPLIISVGMYLFLIGSTIYYESLPINLNYKTTVVGKEWFYVFLTMFALPFIFNLTNKIHVDRIIGELSYPIYLSHLLVITFLIKVMSVQPNQSSSTLLFISVTTLVSFIIFYFFERPIEKFRQNRLKHAPRHKSKIAIAKVALDTNTNNVLK